MQSIIIASSFRKDLIEENDKKDKNDKELEHL